MAAVTVIDGGDDFLNRRLLREWTQAYAKLLPEADVVAVASDASAAQIDLALAPSLLSNSSIVTIASLQDMDADAVDALCAFAQQQKDVPPQRLDHVVIASRSTGAKGTGAVTKLRNRGAVISKVPTLKYPRDRSDFVEAEFRRHGKRINPDAKERLVAAYGSHTADLAGMCEQLCDDFDAKVITIDIVQQYASYGAEETGFDIADAAFGGNTAQAVVKLRQAYASGMDSIPIIAALSYKLRQLAQYAKNPSGDFLPAGLRKYPSLMNKRLTQMRREMRGFTSQSMARCFEALAQADQEAKSSAGDPRFALERAVELIASKGQMQ